MRTHKRKITAGVTALTVIALMTVGLVSLHNSHSGQARQAVRVAVTAPQSSTVDLVARKIREAQAAQYAAAVEHSHVVDYLNAMKAQADAKAQADRVAAEKLRRSTPTTSHVVQQAPSAGTEGPTYHGNPAGSVNGYPCGGDLPPCYVLRRESGGNPRAQNPTSTASGLWQFLRTTWMGFGGYTDAKDAPPSVQNEKARQLWNGGRGCSAWLAC